MSETLRDRRLRYAQAILQSQDSSLTLLGQRSEIDGRRVLVLGTSPTETLCSLMHTECRWAEARAPDAHAQPHSADVVLVPHATLATIGRIVDQASRSLDRSGRIIIAVTTQEPDFIDVTSRALVQAGFETPYLQGNGNQTRIHAVRGRAEAIMRDHRFQLAEVDDDDSFRNLSRRTRT